MQTNDNSIMTMNTKAKYFPVINIVKVWSSSVVWCGHVSILDYARRPLLPLQLSTPHENHITPSYTMLNDIYQWCLNPYFVAMAAEE